MNKRSESQFNIKFTARFVHRRKNTHRRKSTSSSSKDESEKKAKKQHYCKLCKKSEHDIDDCYLLNEVIRHVFKSKSKSMSKSDFKNFKFRASKHSFKNRSTSRKKKPAIKDLKKPKFHRAYSADFDSKKKFNDEKSKFKNKSKTYVTKSNKTFNEKHSKNENKAA